MFLFFLICCHTVASKSINAILTSLYKIKIWVHLCAPVITLTPFNKIQ